LAIIYFNDWRLVHSDLSALLDISEHFFLLFSQIGRNLDGIGQDKVTEVTFFLVDREAFSFQFHHSSVLSFRFYFQFYFTVQGHHGNVSSKDGCKDVQRNRSIQIVVLPFEYRIFLYNESNIQVAGRSSVCTGSSIAVQFDDLTVGNTCRDCYPDTLSVDVQYLFVCDGRFTQGQMQFRLIVLSFVAFGVGRSAPLAFTEKFFEKIRKTAWIAVAKSAGFESTEVETIESACIFVLPVVLFLLCFYLLFPLFRITKHFIGFVYFLKLIFC